MRVGPIVVLGALLVSPAVLASQGANLVLPDLQALQRQAADSVNITLDPWLLRGVSAFMDDKQEDGVAMKNLLNGIKSIQIRSFKFGGDFEYPTAAIDGLHRQLAEPGWTRMVQVHNRKEGEDVDMYLMMDQSRASGFALIASDPRELTIINIVGSIDMNDLPMLERHFHLPQFGLAAASL